MNPYQSSLKLNSKIINNEKRDVLWNVIEPGDPFDIKRSMIANLPGKKGTSLQGKTELVCLLQAAEIERLNEYLQEYNVRYKGAQRKQMDRHSYQVQIRELTEKIQYLQGHEAENEKLKKYIKRLQTEFDELRGQMDKVNRANSQLNNQAFSLKNNLSQNVIKINRITQEHEKTVRDLTYKTDREVQGKVYQVVEEIDRLNYLLAQRNREKQNIQREKKELQAYIDRQEKQGIQTIQNQKRQIRYLEDLNSQLQKSIYDLKEQHRNSNDYENQLRIMKGDYDKVRSDLTKKDNTMRDLKDQLYRLESQLTIKDNQVNQHVYRVQALNQQNDQIKRQHTSKQKNIDVLKRQNDSLNERLSKIEQGNYKLRRQIEYLESENQSLRSEIKRLNEDKVDQNQYLQKQFQNQLSQAVQRQTELQNKYVLVATQVQRLERILRERDEKIKKMNQFMDQQQAKGRGISNKYIDATQALEQLHKENQRQQREHQIDQEHAVEKITLLETQIQRLNLALRKKVNENSDNLSRAKNIEFQNQSLKSRLFQIQTDSNLIKIENQNLKKRLNETGYAIDQYETRMPSISQEIDRLQSLIMKRDQIIQGLENKFKAKEQTATKLKKQLYEANNKTIDAERKISDLQNQGYRLKQDLKFSNHENALLKRRIKEIEDDFKGKQRELDDKIEKGKNQKAIIQRQLLQNENDLNKQKYLKEEIIEKHDHLQKQKQQKQKQHQKKHKKNKINDAYTNTRIMFLEEQIKRLKKEKVQLSDILAVQLKSQLQRVLAENVRLRNHINELNNENDIRASEHANQLMRITQEKDSQINELAVKNKNSFHKDKFKQIIKNANRDANDRNRFYEEEIKRMKNQKKLTYERLNTQIQEQNQNLKDYKIKNASLTENLNNLERKNHQLQKDLDNTTNNLNSQEGEKQKLQSDYRYLKERYDESQQKNYERNQKIYDLQNSLEEINHSAQQSKRDSDYKGREYQVKIGTLQRQKHDLLQENGYLRKDIEDRDGQITDMRLKQSKFISHIRDLQFTLEDLAQKYRNRGNQLEETTRNHQTLQNSLQDFNQTKNKLSRTERQKQYLNKQIKNIHQVLEKTKASNDELNKVSRFHEDEKIKSKEQYETKINTFESTVFHLTSINQKLKMQQKELQKRFNDISLLLGQREDEVQNLNHLLNEKMDELSYFERNKNQISSENQTLRKKVSALQQQLRQANQQSTDKLVISEQNIAELQRSLTQLKKQRSNSIHEFNTKITQYQNKIAIMREEIERLKEKSNDMEKTYSKKVAQTEFHNNELRRGLEDLSNEHAKKTMSYENNLTSLNVELKKKSTSEEQLNKKLIDQEKITNFTNVELNKLREVLTSKDDQIHGLKRQKDENFRKYQKASAEREGEAQKIIVQKNQYQRLLMEYNNLQKKLNEYQTSLQTMETEFDRLQLIISKLKKQRQTSLSKNRALISEIQRLKNLNNQYRIRVQQLGLRFSDEVALEKRVKEHLALFVVLFAEIQSLRIRIAEQQKQIEEVRRDSLQPLKL